MNSARPTAAIALCALWMAFVFSATKSVKCSYPRRRVYLWQILAFPTAHKAIGQHNARITEVSERRRISPLVPFRLSGGAFKDPRSWDSRTRLNPIRSKRKQRLNVTRKARNIHNINNIALKNLRSVSKWGTQEILKKAKDYSAVSLLDLE